jgi:(p)ppGpp synthase/HD superfamily hydrolase
MENRESKHWSPDEYAAALLFAAQAHGEQKVPGTELPYISHVVLVAMEVINALDAEPGRSAEEQNLAVRAALLHDVVEDTPTRPEEVADLFGGAVRDAILALTKNTELPTKQEQMADSLERIRQQPHTVWMVKLADRITNLMPPPHYWTEEKIVAYRDEAKQIHDALAEASPYLAARLRDRIAAYGPRPRTGLIVPAQ